MSDVGSALSTLSSNISTVNNNINIVHHAIQAVEMQVEEVSRQHSSTRGKLDELIADFASFVLEYKQKAEWQLAQTRIVEVRQKFESEFGYYDEVRRTATGLLQASDLGIVREEAMRKKAEDFLITCPGYWLAPTLTALVGWLTDQRKLADDALAEALKRSDAKTSLFFALVCRRARRDEACLRWLERYFQNQNPSAMQREVAVMLDAVVNGAFGAAALSKSLTVVNTWLEELEEQPGFVDEQRKRWADTLDVKKPHVGPREYPTLRKQSPTWPGLENALAATRRNQIVHDFFEALFAGEIATPPSLEATIDFVLNTLVTEFDAAELPLRRELTKLELIIAEEGNKTTAENRFASEVEALREITNFGAILTNAAMYPEQSGTTRATQRYAVTLSQRWIIDGFGDLVARERAAIPLDVDIEAGAWAGSSKDGTNEAALVTDCERFYERRIAEAVDAIKIEMNTWVLMGIGALFGLYVAAQVSPVAGLLGLAGLGAYGYFKYRDVERRKIAVREEMEKERDVAIKILRASLAELTDLRRDLATEDAKAETVMTLLESLHSSQMIVAAQDTARSVLN